MGGGASVKSSFPVTVNPSTPTAVVIVDAPQTAESGETVEFGVAAKDAFGNVWGDASADVTYSSDVSADVFGTTFPNEVTLHGAGTHTITVAHPSLESGSVSIDVSAPAGSAPPDKEVISPSSNHDRSPALLATTGGTATVELAILGAFALALGLAVLVWRRLGAAHR